MDTRTGTKMDTKTGTERETAKELMGSIEVCAAPIKHDTMHCGIASFRELQARY